MEMIRQKTFTNKFNPNRVPDSPSLTRICCPTVIGKVDDNNQLFRIPGIGTMMYVYMGLTIDATLEAIRELRKVPEFQRHEGKKAVNNLHKLAVECDDRMCRLVGDKDLAWLEDTKEIFLSEVGPDLMRYRISVNNIVNKCGYHGATSYSYAVIARSLAKITSEWEEDIIFNNLGKQAIVGGQIMQTANASKGYYRLFGTQQFDNAFVPLDRIYERDKNLQLNIRKVDSDVQNIHNGARIVVGKVLNAERILEIGKQQKELAYEHH